MCRIIAALMFLAMTTAALAQGATPAASADAGQVVVSGNVPDDATRAAVLQKLRSLYGADRVVDKLSVGGVVTPANWSQYIENMIGPNLKQVSHGQISVRGNTVSISGEVSNEAVRQDVLSNLSRAFDSHYGINQQLAIGQSKQTVLDQTLANRTIEFESGSAILTPAGIQVLDQMATAIQRLDNPSIQIIGNTDNLGNPTANLQLSLERARAVKAYLVSKGIPAADLSVSGQGADNPIASNATEAGRARNRRIDFRIAR